MPSISQIRGAILEECILMLLRAAGYRTVTTAGSDPTLSMTGAGLAVAGRGTKHQIDAIADLRIGQPFSNPQRLLIEGKAFADHRKVGLPVVRNCVGMLKDVSEFWVSKRKLSPVAARYHYQVAIFGTSEFTSEAQRYAFAHDIYLLPLGRSAFFRPLVLAIDSACDQLQEIHGDRPSISPTSMRSTLRRHLQPELPWMDADEEPAGWLEPVRIAAAQIGQALVATIGYSFPLFLTPSPGVDLNKLSASEFVGIHFSDRFDTSGWEIRRLNGDVLFTFDMPTELFDHYAEEGKLTPAGAVALKEAVFGEFTAIYAPNDQIKIFNFRLDREWLAQLRDLVRQRSG